MNLLPSNSLSNNVSSINLFQSVATINKSSSLLIKTLPDADYELTEAEHGYGSYYFVGAATTATRTVTFNPLYHTEPLIGLTNAYTTETLDIAFDGGTPISLTANQAASTQASASSLVFVLAGTTP